VLAAKPALHASINEAGKDAPEPCRSVACAGVVEAISANAIEATATFAILENFIYFPLCVWLLRVERMRIELHPWCFQGKLRQRFDEQ
jgi:hypothetical protein